jgi:hypothetical protein
MQGFLEGQGQAPQGLRTIARVWKWQQPLAEEEITKFRLIASTEKTSDQYIGHFISSCDSR